MRVPARRICQFYAVEDLASEKDLEIFISDTTSA
jgi:hypothetical protein